MNSKLVRTMCAATLCAMGSTAQVIWTELDANGPGRRGHAMTFDIARNRVVLFGGTTSGSLGDTWEWNGLAWTQVANSGPGPRTGHAIAFDALRERTVLFGGTQGGLAGDTWLWDGSAWSQVLVTGPTARTGHAMAYDTVRSVVVLFGGNGVSLLQDTWEWDGTTWTQVSAVGPGRFGHAMCYDSSRQRIVMFGGSNAGWLGDTWEWNGIAWTQASASGPPARTGHSVVFATGRGRTLLFGGVTGGLANDTWEWDGSVWSLVQTTAPSARSGHAMAYDTLQDRTILFGGTSTAIQDDTWVCRIVEAATATYGLGCGNPLPAFAPRAGSRPLLGQIQLSDIANVPFGFAAVVWGVTQQSLSLDFVGINGCTLLNGGEFEIGSFCQSTSFTSAQHSLAIPYDLTLLGLHVYLQAWTIAPGFNPLGIALSNGLELVIGDI